MHTMFLPRPVFTKALMLAMAGWMSFMSCVLGEGITVSDWPQFRGPDARGAGKGKAAPPLKSPACAQEVHAREVA